MIFDWDFDTTLPGADDPEEFDEWSMDTPGGQKSTSVPGRNISCFSASATLGMLHLPCCLYVFIYLLLFVSRHPRHDSSVHLRRAPGVKSSC